MNLPADRFSQTTIAYRIGAVAPIQYARRYTYESASKLYDVTLYAEGTKYSVNGFFADFTPYHAAIVKHFGLKG